MRSAIAASLGAVLLLAVATAAFGDSDTTGTTVQQASAAFTTAAPGHSAGLRIATAATGPANTRNRQPKRITNVSLTLPRGSKIDSTGAVTCAATDEDFANASDPDDACPRGSRMGTGHAALRASFAGTPDVRGTVRAYAANRSLLLFVDWGNAAEPWVLHAKFRGRRLTIAIPQAGSPQVELVLTELAVNTTPKARRVRHETRRFLKTPARCPSGGWEFVSSFRYADGTTLDIPSSSRCRRP